MKRPFIFSLLCCIALFCACSKGGNSPEEEGYKYEAVFIGDSITANWVKEDRGHPDFFKDHNYLGMGYPGKTTDYLKRLFKLSVIDKQPRQAVILGGINDIAQNDGRYVPIEEIRDNIASMAEEASAEGIRVVLCSVTPSKGFTWSSSVSHPETIIIELNKLIKALAAENGYAYADYHSALADAGGGLPSSLSSDGTHPNKDGYTIMESIILPILQAYPDSD
ncbi:MAG: acylhydrolase [Bacteroidales bacterium]|nr:acylhydrolase [Bacteroidales bacterium]